MITRLPALGACALVLAVAAPAAALQSPQAAATFQTLKAELEGMQARTADGRAQRLTLTGQPCRSTLTKTLEGSDIVRARTSTMEWRWAETDETEVFNLLKPLVLLADDEGGAELEMDTEERAERVAGLFNTLRRQCGGR